MKGILSHELDVELSADEVWAVYGSLRLNELAVELLPHYLERIEVKHGDGGVNTIIEICIPGGHSHKDKYVKVDNKDRIKETIVVEGGYLALGFKYYLARFEIIKKSKRTSTIISTIEYELNDDDIKNASLATIDLLADAAKAISQYLIKNQYVINKD